MKIVSIIPARGGSKRLLKKNIFPIWGKPMIFWAIEACKESRFINDIYVSTENSEIANISKKYGAKIIDRPTNLADDFTFKQDVIIHAVKQLPERPEIVVSVQANSPQISAKDLDDAINKLICADRKEIFSVDNELLQNGAFRIMRYEYVFQKSISTYSGVFVTDYIDVHTLEDVTILENDINRKISEKE